MIHPDFSYKIIGILFDVHNNLGAGHKEKYYQNAVAVALKIRGIEFQEQVYTPLLFKGSNVGKYYLDFLIDGQIVLELKVGETFLKQNISQVYSYLRVNNLQLGIIANFTKAGLKYKRILNII